MEAGTGSHDWTLDRVIGLIGLKWDVFINPLPSKIRDLYRGGGGRKILEARGDGQLQGISVFQMQHHAHMN